MPHHASSPKPRPVARPKRDDRDVLATESVWDFPRPPALEPFSGTVRIELGGAEVCRSTRAWRVLETSHPPVYYIPPDDFVSQSLHPAGGGSFCEWKGRAAYWDVTGGEKVAPKAAWSYPQPTADFEAIRDYVAVYAHHMDACWVNDEQVTAQPGGFYGGWVTSNLIGPFKGGPGTVGW